MDDNSIPEQSDEINPQEPTQAPAPIAIDSENEADVLSASLKALAGASGGALSTAVEDFLDGKGELLEATRTASSKASKTARFSR